MAFRNSIIVSLAVLLLYGCAQVGIISGGPEDNSPPTPIEGLTIPPNKTVRFTNQGFSLTFAEFIQLNNPQQTVVMVPGHAKPNLSIVKKTVRVDWKEFLQPNTTYVVYFNGAIKDISEGNDTLFTYVFSTGDSIDSLTYTVPVVDAYTNRSVKDITVGLFTDSLTDKPLYFARTAANGFATFRYLSSGQYFLRALDDKNKDLTIQEQEPIAFRTERIQLDSNRRDTIPLRLFQPISKKIIQSFRFQAPGSFYLSANQSLKEAQIFVNDTIIDASHIRFIRDDSLHFFRKTQGTLKFDLKLTTPTDRDSASIRVMDKGKKSMLTILPLFENGKIGPADTLSFFVNDYIVALDTSKLVCTDPTTGDTIPFQAKFEKNLMRIHLDRKNKKQLALTFHKGFAKGEQVALSDSLMVGIELLTEKDVGTISVDASAFQGQIILQLLRNNKIVEEIQLRESKKQTFGGLTPGDYTFSVIEDRNENGRWDTGSIKTFLQPEIVRLFSKPTSVRANWEMDVKLSP